MGHYGDVRPFVALALALAAGCAEKHSPADPDAGSTRDAGPEDAGRDAGRDAGAEPDAGECVPMPIVDPGLLPSCEFCMGRCVSAGGLDAETRALLRDCTESHECVPDEFLESGGNYTLESCRSVFGVEGRCTSLCLEGVAAQMDTLPQDVCGDGHRCVPCYDPIDGSDTGACTVGCDEGPTDPPFVLTDCCDGQATCVPEDSVAEESRSFFDACTEPGTLCVPDRLIAEPEYEPASCTTDAIRETYGDAYGPGACWPACLAGLDEYVDTLEQNDCGDGFLCIPCTSPIDDTATGACPPPT